MSKEERHKRRERALEAQADNRVQDFELLSRYKLEPYVSEDGSAFTVRWEEDDYPQGLGALLFEKSHLNALVRECQEEATTEHGRQVLAKAYGRYLDRRHAHEELEG